MKFANLTISRVQCSSEDDYISLSIEDGSSSVTIITLKVPFKEFAQAITGLGYQKVEIKHVVDEKMVNVLGKTKITKSIDLDMERCIYDRDKKKEAVLKQANVLPEILSGEWELWDDGTRSQQNKLNKHTVILVKYVEEV